MVLTLDNSVRSLLAKQTHRFALLWKIERTDGTMFRFTSHDRKITVGMETWNPVGGFNSSARRKEAGLKEQSSEFLGVISSSAITTDDLRAGRYRDAKITEQVVDWRYPWAGFFQTNVYFVDEVRWNGELWEADVVGLTSKLEHQVGDIFTRNCSYQLYDPDTCQADKPTFSLFGRQVETLTSRRLFRAYDTGPTSIPFAGFADDYFALGEIEWLDGNNVGLKSNIRSYTQTSREIELQLPTPFDIQVNDTFNIAAGCDKRRDTCINKFSNFIHYGGFLFIPGTKEILKGPQ